MFSRNQVLGGELDEAVARADAATVEAREAKQELMRQARSVLRTVPVYLKPRSPLLCTVCRGPSQGIVWEQRELSLVQQVADAEKAVQRAASMEAEIATMKADLRLREQVAPAAQ